MICNICEFKGNENEHATHLIENEKILLQHVEFYLHGGVEGKWGPNSVKPRNMAKWIANGMMMPSKRMDLKSSLKNVLSRMIKKIIIDKGWSYDKDFKCYTRLES